MYPELYMHHLYSYALMSVHFLLSSAFWQRRAKSLPFRIAKSRHSIAILIAELQYSACILPLNSLVT
jgi:hypothetical protein